MGMAAGQARLLSITSRMSDNELRAQIINNNKMRLATQSSQASEAYVTALNEAQMMFTNYDKDNNTSYQKLTYNALTAYNPYNNQYIVTNASGNVLLSETDAVNYKNANGDVKKFLQAYGLNYTTTYFDNLTAHATTTDDGKIGIEFKTGVVDADDGSEYLGVVFAPNSGASAQEVAKYIQDLYEGNLTTTYGSQNTKLHPGYMNSVASEDYYNYSKLLADYTVKKDAYIETIASKMAERLTQSTKNGVYHTDYSGTEADTLKAIADKVKDPTTDTTDKMTNCLNDLSSFITNVGAKYCADGTGNSVITSLLNTVNSVKGNTVTDKLTKNDSSFEVDGNNLTLKSGDQVIFTLTKTPPATSYTGYSIPYLDASGNTQNLTGTISGNAIQYNISADGTTINNGVSGDVTKDYKISIPNEIINGTADLNNGNWEVNLISPNSLENMRATASAVIDKLRSSIYSIWDPTNSAFRDTSDPTYSAYIDAARKLSQQIFGKDVGPNNYDLLDDIEACFNRSLSSEFTGDKKNDFQKIYDAYILDCIMNTYGEPKYAWIDTTKPQNTQLPGENPDHLADSSYNVNGDVKAQWYENLFTRIQKGGFKVLQDGLASSNEWIQFAFESGIITMEQVDANKNWQPLIYSNCSDITEQTNDAAIAKAEAEYKAAMNKIENKDKRYDLELKNIDTEHNSLQVEYDSIKTAIDKNIERTFKLYS